MTFFLLWRASMFQNLMPKTQTQNIKGFGFRANRHRARVLQKKDINY